MDFIDHLRALASEPEAVARREREAAEREASLASSRAFVGLLIGLGEDLRTLRTDPTDIDRDLETLRREQENLR